MQTLALTLASVLLLLTNLGAASAETTRTDIGAVAIRAFKVHCYEPNRRGGRAAEPNSESGWQLVPEAMRAQLGIDDEPALKAWLRPGAAPQDLLLLQIHERRLENAGIHSGQMRISCRVAAVSEKLRPQLLQHRLSRVIGSPPGSNRPEVLERLGYPTPEGWQQRCWTILTKVRNTSWQPTEHDGRPSCVWLTSPRNYALSQYVVVRLLTREDGGTATLEFDRTLRADALPERADSQ